MHQCYLAKCDQPFKRPSAEAYVSETVQASAAILAAVAAGHVTPDEAGRVMALLVGHRSIMEASDLEARITALELSSDR